MEPDPVYFPVKDVRGWDMTQERRAYQRRSVYWDADVSGEGFGPLAFEIRDFCEGGLFLVAATRTADQHLRQQVSARARVRIGFADPLTGRRRQVEGAIAREAGHGFGVAFDAPQPELVSALDTIAASTRSAASGELRADADRQALTRDDKRRNQALVEHCSDLISDFLAARLDSFTSQAEGALFHAAEGAASNAVQAAYFGGIRMLKNHRGQFTAGIRELALANWSELGRFSIAPEQDAAVTTDQLALVDEGEFEDWLQRSEVVSRAETRAIRSLRHLQRRLSALEGRSIDEYHNPISPVALCSFLAGQLAIFRPEQATRGVIYQSFGKALLNQLGVLYDGLNVRLRDAGVLPDLEGERYRIRSVRSSGPTVTAPDTAGSTGQTADPQADAIPAAPATGISGLYRTVRDLFRASRQASEQASAPPATTLRPAPPELLQNAARALASHTVVPGGETPLRQQLQDQLQQSDPELGLGPEQAESIDLLEHWFSELRPRADDNGFFRDWSHRLIPAAMAQELRDGGFLQQRDRPIHRLIDALDRAANSLAASRPADRPALQAQLESALGRAVAAEGDPARLQEAADSLDASVERSRRAVEAGMERVRQMCEGSQRLALAREAVEEALNARLGDRQVPSPLLRLIEEGWRNHLVLVDLRHGQEGPHWRRGLRAVELLLAGLGSEDVPRRRIREPRKLLQYVARALARMNRPEKEVRALIEELERWLAEPLDGPYPPSGRFEPVASEEPPPPPDADTPQEWLGRAKLLNPGDWVQVPDDNGEARPLRLAWVSRHRDRFVFINRTGQRAAELNLGELSRVLGEQTEPAEDLNAPATVRRWQDMLVKLNQQLSHQATHDPLTGLLNRKAMQRRIRHLMEDPRAEAMEHVFCQFALDEFKLVNNTLGHEGGDLTLRDVAELLQEEAGRRVLLARMGGDEFAVLMVRTSREDATEFVEHQLERLRSHRFGTEERPVRLTASAGMVGFTRQSHSEETLLRDVDHACFRAKESGGNRCHLVRPGDSELADLQQSMNQATRVDRALEGGMLRLRCQRIIPLQNEELPPLFEVLITMADSDHTVIRPDQFIPAAERFGRMPALDRWVIREVFDWCRSHPDTLRGIGALSINLSGQTLNDIGFLDYLQGEFDAGRIPPEKICFEVTETAAMANLSVAADLIRELKRMGCRFALDDFGSGLSSYSYLKNLPADLLKIDGEFIRELDSPAADDAMVRSIHELCHHLGKLTVAEYVESDAIRMRLRGIGLDYAQGYGIEYPVPLDELVANALVS